MRRSSSYLLVIPVALAIAAGSVTAATQGRKTRSKKAATMKTADHPKIHAAIASLEAAKADLQSSKKDFGGHRQDAIDAVNDALKRLRLALQFEKY